VIVFVGYTKAALQKKFNITFGGLLIFVSYPLDLFFDRELVIPAL